MSTPSKVMTAAQAVSTFVHDGDYLAFGGFSTNRRAYGLVHELLRQGQKGLYIESGAAGGDIDMLIGAGRVEAILISYIANSGYTQICRRFRHAVENGDILFDDYSLDAQTMMYHAAALGIPYIPCKFMLGSDIAEVWGISAEERSRHPKLPPQKFMVQDDPFHPGETLCLLPAPQLDVAFIHVQQASPDGTCRIAGAPFQDVDLAVAARHTVVSCEELLSDEEIRRHPERNTLAGLCVDAVVHMPYGAHPSQCFGFYDYDAAHFKVYDEASRTQEGFDAYLRDYILDPGSHEAYLDKLGAGRLTSLRVKPELGYAPRRKGGS